MAKRSKKRKAPEQSSDRGRARESVSVPPPNGGGYTSTFSVWIPLVLAALTFLAYWPSLSSDFVYDAHIEIIDEGFITSISNLPAVLSLKVLGMNLMLGDRPGQLLYLMLIAAICGKGPLGYHLCSNLLHAANVALLFVFLRRLIAVEAPGLTRASAIKAQWAAAVVTLIFALHPINVEAVADISYSSDLLVTFFTVLALLAAMAFRPEQSRIALLAGSAGVLCALASVMCKESGLTTALLLIVYWFLFRRREAKGPWLCFLGAAIAVTAAFLTARFLIAPPNPTYLNYLGGSLAQVFWIQPRIWVFMMGKLVWPEQFSANYVPEDMHGLFPPIAMSILLAVVVAQGWLAWRSRIGALGVAFYWLGLSTVSNFFPLYRPMADRFYYLPMAGVVLQLAALFLMTLKSRAGFWAAMAPCLLILVPLTLLTFNRQAVFASDFALWSDTAQASPRSALAHSNLGRSLDQIGRVDEAIAELQTALYLYPDYADAHYNLGIVLYRRGQIDQAMVHLQTALQVNPRMAQAHYNLGLCYSQKGRPDDEIAEYEKALAINPAYVEARNNLAVSLFQKGQVNDAILQTQEALRLKPGDAELENNLIHMQAAARHPAKH